MLMSVFIQVARQSMMGTRTVHMRGRQQGEGWRPRPLIDRPVADDARFWILRPMGPRLHLASTQRNGQELQNCLPVGRSSVTGHAEEVSEAESRIESLVVMCHHRRDKIHQTASTSIPLLTATGL